MFRIVFVLLLILPLVPVNSVLAQTPSPSISISPTSGAPTITTITVSGSNFTADTSVTVKFNGNIVGNASTGDGGSWTQSFVVPKSPQGSHEVEAGDLSATFTVTSRTLLSTYKGKVGSQVTVTGDGYAASQSGITLSFGGEQISTVAANSLGSFTSSFIVPPRPKGDYSVVVGSSLHNFELIAAFSISPTTGPPGITVELLGSGFTPNASGSVDITFDGNVVVSTSMDSQGSIATSFQIPVSPGGPHSVGVSHTSTGTTYSTFTVTPTLSLDRLNVAPGDTVTATGAGFAIKETAITVLIDVTPVATGVSADSEGSFTTSLIVPSLPSGSHSTRASGPRTSVNKVPPVTLILGAGISLVHSDGPPGSVVEVFGSGFASNESVTVTAGNRGAEIVATANSRGAWQANVTIPDAPTGRLSIKASASGGVPVETDFTVSPKISMVGPGGEPGATVLVKGAGFAANETGIRLILDGDLVASGISASTEGSWNGSFSLPSVPTGSYNLHASGSQTLGTSVPKINLAVSADLKLDLTSGPPGTATTVRGAGFKSGESVTVTVGQGANSVNVVANADGVWTANVAIPESPSGLLPIQATGASGQQMAASFIVTPSISLSSPYGSPTSSLQIKGVGFGAEREIAVSLDSASIATLSSDAEGSWSVIVPVPESPAGDYPITVLSLGGEQEVLFSITPSIVLSETHGEPGAILNLSGFGFASTERGISVTLDEEPLISGISADALGSWHVAFPVPAVSGDTYTVEASGPETSVASLPDEIVTITPSLVVRPASGVPGSPVSLTGSGFRSQERAIVISYDGTAVVTGINADASGTFRSSFTVPPSSSGLHFISHSSAVTLASGGSAASFQVVEGISIDFDEGPPDSGLTVRGSGFTANDPLISITYDSDRVLVQATSDAQGSFTESIQIPASTAGTHVIGVRSPNLSSGTNPEQTFYVVPDVELSISSGNVGGRVEVVGLGFGSLAPIALSYDDELTETTTVTDVSGSFFVEFPIPSSVHGDHTIKATDEDGQGDQAAFSVEDSAPAVAALLTPGSGARGGFFGGYRPLLDWGPIEDPSGVTYDLQIGTSPEFLAPILEKRGLDNASYALLERDALPRGTYHWRVRAVDGASNEAPWSESFVVKSGLVAPWVFVMLITLGLLATGCGGYSYVYIRRKRLRRAGAFPEFARDVSVIPELTELGASPAPALRAPFRLALPAPSRRRRTRTPEEQAHLQLVLDFMHSLPLIEVTYELKWMDELMDSARGEVTDVIEQVLNGHTELNYQPEWLRHPTYQEVRHILEGHEFLQRLDEYIHAVNDIALDTVSLVRQADADVVASGLSPITQGDQWRFDLGIVQNALGWFRGVYLRQASARDYLLVPVSGSNGEVMVSLHGEETTPFPGPILEYVEEEQAVQYRDLHIQIRSNYTNSEEARSLAARMVSVDLLREQLNGNLAELGQAM